MAIERDEFGLPVSSKLVNQRMRRAALEMRRIAKGLPPTKAWQATKQSDKLVPPLPGREYPSTFIGPLPGPMDRRMQPRAVGDKPLAPIRVTSAEVAQFEKMGGGAVRSEIPYVWNLGRLDNLPSGGASEILKRGGNITTNAAELLHDAGFRATNTFRDNLTAMNSITKSSMAELPDDLVDVIRANVETFTKTTIGVHQEDLVRLKSLTDRAELLSGRLRNGKLGKSTRQAIHDELNQINSEAKVLRSKVRGNRGQIYDLASLERKLMPSSSDDEYVMDTISRLADGRMGEAMAGDDDFRYALEAYELDLRRQRSAQTTTQRFFRVRAAQKPGGAMMGGRGQYAYSMMDIGESVRYTIDPETKMRIPSTDGRGEAGVFARPRSLVPEPLLGDLEHRVVSYTAAPVDPVVRPELAHISRDLKKMGRSLAGDETDESMEILAEQSSKISTRVNKSFQEAFARITDGEIITDAMRGDLEKAQSMFIGTLYNTPATGDYAYNLPGHPGRRAGTVMRGILAEEDDSFIRNLLYEVSPELRDYAKRGRPPSRADLPRVLTGTAVRMDIPGSTGYAAAERTGIHSEINLELQRRARIRSVRARVTSSLDSHMESGGAAIYGHAEAPPELGFVDEIEDAFGSIIDSERSQKRLTQMSERIDEGIYRFLESNNITETPPAVRRALEISREFSLRDMSIVMSDYSEATLAQIPEMSDLDAKAYAILSKHAGEIDPVAKSAARAVIAQTEDPLEAAFTAAFGGSDEVAADVAKILTGESRKAVMRSIAVRGAHADTAQMIDAIIAGGKPTVSPLIGRNQAEVFLGLDSLRERGAVMRIGTADFGANYLLENVDTLDRTDDLSRLTLTLNIEGDRAAREAALIQAGYTEEYAARAAAQPGPLRMNQAYEYQSIGDVMFDDIADVEKDYRKFVRQTLIDNNVATEDLNWMVQERMDEFLDSQHEIIQQVSENVRGMGHYVPIAAPEHIMDVGTEAHIAQVMESVDEISTVTKDRASYTDTLINRVFDLKNRFGERGTPSRASEALFRFDEASGTVQFGRAFEPLMGPSRMEMPEAARSVLDEIVEGLGGQEEFKKLLELSKIGEVGDLSEGVVGDIFADTLSGSTPFVDPNAGVFGPLASGNQVRVPYDASDEVKKLFRETVGVEPATPVPFKRGTLGEIVAQAIDARERGVTTPGRTSSDIVRELIVNPVKKHTENIRSEGLVPFLSDDQAEVMGVKGAARAEAEAVTGFGDTIKAGRVRQTKASFSQFAKMWSENKSVKYGSIGIAGLAAWGFWRNHNRDRTPEDMAGPPNLPGGSAYENPPQGFTSPNRASFNGGGGGVTYHVEARGQFDPEELASEMSRMVGGSTQMNIRQNEDPFRAHSKKMEDMINAYT